MADTIDLDGEKFVSPSFVTSATSLDDIYTAWVADFQGVGADGKLTHPAD
ncbi:hypothetical protein ACNQJ9_10155 [Pseudomonas aeruginosa]